MGDDLTMICSVQKKSVRMHACFVRLTVWLGRAGFWATAAVQMPPFGAQEPVAESVRARSPIDTTPISESPITPGDRAHWAFSPVVRPRLPSVRDKEWARNAVDAFIQARLEAAGV